MRTDEFSMFTNGGTGAVAALAGLLTAVFILRNLRLEGLQRSASVYWIAMSIASIMLAAGAVKAVDTFSSSPCSTLYLASVNQQIWLTLGVATLTGGLILYMLSFALPHRLQPAAL